MMTKSQCAKYQPKTYDNKFLLEKAYDHLITERKSVWTFAHPTKQTYDNRCREDDVFNEQFQSIRMLSEQNLETILWENMENKEFNDKLFNMATRNKKAFQTYEVNEIEQRITILEDARNGS